MKNMQEYIKIAKQFEAMDAGNFDNEKAYHKTWKIMKDMKEIDEFDTNSAWDKMMNRFEKEELVPETKVKFRVMNGLAKRLILVAASVIIAFFVAVLWNNYTSSNKELVVNNTPNVMEYTLNDGTSVFLKSGSELSILAHYNEKKRMVELKGEAFFSVARNEHVPFEVYANTAKVRVLGTSFNVKTFSNVNHVEVLVKTGKVAFSEKRKPENKMDLIPNEHGVLSSGLLTKSIDVNNNYMAWMDKKLVFKDAPINQVIEDLSHAYGIDILVANDSLNSLSITSTYYNLSADELIESLCITLNISHKKIGKNYILDSQ